MGHKVAVNGRRSSFKNQVYPLLGVLHAECPHSIPLALHSTTLSSSLPCSLPHILGYFLSLFLLFCFHQRFSFLASWPAFCHNLEHRVVPCRSHDTRCERKWPCGVAVPYTSIKCTQSHSHWMKRQWMNKDVERGKEGARRVIMTQKLEVLPLNN